MLWSRVPVTVPCSRFDMGAAPLLAREPAQEGAGPFESLSYSIRQVKKKVTAQLSGWLGKCLLPNVLRWPSGAITDGGRAAKHAGST